MPYNIHCIQLLLRNLDNLELTTANDGLRAIEVIEADRTRAHEEPKIRMIIMDINMPNMDGIQATTILKQKYGEELYIMILTAFSDEIEIQRAQTAGANSFLTKPLTISKLFNEFRKAGI